MNYDIRDEPLKWCGSAHVASESDKEEEEDEFHAYATDSKDKRKIQLGY